MQKALYTREHKRLVRLLRETREARGLTQTDLARKLRRPQSFVSKFESGQRRLDLVELAAICNALDTKLLDFVRAWERRT